MLPVVLKEGEYTCADDVWWFYSRSMGQYIYM